jgi:hypothetical protein
LYGLSRFQKLEISIANVSLEQAESGMKNAYDGSNGNEAVYVDEQIKVNVLRFTAIGICVSGNA